MRIKPLALYPGSFDPPTRGHENIITRAREQFDIRIGVGVNPGKSSAFSLQERVRLLQALVFQHGIDPLSVIRIPGSTARWMKRNSIMTIVRGKRDALDEITERQLAYFNTLENSDISPEIFDSNDELQFASSSSAKMLMKANHDPSSVVTLDVQEALASRLLSQYPVYITGSMGAGKSSLARGIIEEARRGDIAIKHIELDTIAHDIYSTLSDPYYSQIRSEIRRNFGDEVSPEGNWIDRGRLRTKLSDTSGNIIPERLEQLDKIMADPIEFRYRDMIEGFQGVILIDGIMKEGFSFSRLAHHNILMVNTDKERRVDRVVARYLEKGDTVSREFISSIMNQQGSPEEFINLGRSFMNKEKHGSIKEINNTNSIDSRKSFFILLNQIDRYGELRTTWILKKLGIQGNIREHLNFLQSHYNQVHRYYHTWEHIVESLSTLFQMAIDMDLSDEDIVIIGGAILGHDIVYNTDGESYRDNEKASAKLWGQYLVKNGVDQRNILLIEELIDETRHGQVQVPDRLVSQVMHDVDMAILGSPDSRYRLYKGDVKNEHAIMLPGESYNTLRRDKFLIPVLNKGNLYKTNWARELLHPQMVENLQNEIAEYS